MPVILGSTEIHIEWMIFAIIQTLVGLICCIIVQFTGSTLYVNKYGEDISIPITVNEYGNFVGKNPVTKLFSGVINWFITCAKQLPIERDI